MVDDASLDRIPGWFRPVDRLLFRWFLEEQARREIAGDLAELGAFMGQSAVLLGDYLREGERLTVVDLFGDEATDQDNAYENASQYAGLSRRAFEANYLSVHPCLPHVLQAPTERVMDVARAGAHRFVHVDASHRYQHVRVDLRSTRELAAEGAVLALDDYRSKHTPGVAAAVWQAVTTEGLHVLILSDNKLYATWSDPEPWRQRLARWLPSSGLKHHAQEVADEPIWVCSLPGRLESRPVLRFAKDVLPPVAVRYLRARRSRSG